jgi:hypothetical protein
LRRFKDIEEVVRNPLPFLSGNLARTDIQTSVDLDGVVVDNFSTETFRKPDG